MIHLILSSCQGSLVDVVLFQESNSFKFLELSSQSTKTLVMSNIVEVKGIEPLDGEKLSIEGSDGSLWDIFEMKKSAENSLDISALDDRIVSIRFNTDGSKMYFLGNSTDTIYQYSLSKPFDLTSASYDSISLNVNSEDDFPRSIAFSSDGTKLYMLGNFLEFVHQYTLTTAFDLATATYDTVSFKVGTQDNHPHAITFNNDGSKMFMVGDTTQKAFQYTLSTPWDLSTLSYDSVSFDLSTEMPMPFAIRFNDLGNTMNIVCRTNNKVYKYNLTTAFDISTSSYSNTFVDLSGMDTTSSTFGFNSVGDKVFFGGWDSDKLFEIPLASGGHPEYRVCEDLACTNVLYDWRSDDSGIVLDGNFVQLRTTSASEGDTSSKVKVFIGSLSTSWIIKT